MLFSLLKHLGFCICPSSNADHFNRTTKMSLKFWPLGSQQQSLPLSLSICTLHLGAYSSMSWPLLNQDAALQKQSIIRMVQAQQDCKGHPRRLPNTGSQTFQRTISKHRLFFFLFLLSTQWLKTENDSLLFILSLLTKSQKCSILFFSGSVYKYLKTVSLLHQWFCSASFL